MKIAIDAGHGPDTPGKRSPDGSLREYLFNAPTAKYIADALLQDCEGVEVLLTHSDDRDVPLKERTDRANAWGANLFISIHANAAGDGKWNSAQGIETFVHSSWPAPAVALANAVQRGLILKTGRPDRGVKAADFHVLRETRMTAILVECGFMTNKHECELLKSDSYLRKCAEAIVAGIVSTYGLKKKEVSNVGIYPDVPSDHWAATDIKAVSEVGLMGGFPDGTFKPDEPLTRAQMASILASFDRYIKGVK